MDVWAWICELPSSDDWPETHSPTLELARQHKRSIQLKAERTSGSNSEALVTFSIYFSGFNSLNNLKPVWVSDPCPLSDKERPYLPLVLQLLQEVVTRSPSNGQGSLCPRSKLKKLKGDPVIWIMDSHSPESFATFFNIVFVTRLFWLCVCDSQADVGSLYFHEVFAPNIDSITSFKQAPVLKTFLLSVGVDVEICFMHTLGYMLAKWLILKEVSGLGLVNPKSTTNPNLTGFSYANEAHGFWMLKGYAPVWEMRVVSSSSDVKGKNGVQFPGVFEPNEAALRYGLAHQQLEALVQLEYSVAFHDSYIQVNAHVDNIRLNVEKLGFTKYENDAEYGEERHFPSRIRVWIGPEVGSNYVAGLSLGKSSENTVRKIESTKTMKSVLGKSKAATLLKAKSKTTTRTKTKTWRWDQDAEGNAAVFDTVLCDGATGEEVAGSSWEAATGGGLKKRYSGAHKAFSKTGSLVLAGDEYGERVGWRLGKEMEGNVLTWRIGGKIWLSYCPNKLKGGFYETRCVEWCEEIDLPLIPTMQTTNVL